MAVEKLENTLPAATPPGPSMWGSWQVVRRWDKDRIGPIEEAFQEYGDFVFLNLPFMNLYLARDPDTVEDALVKRHRDFHKDRYYFFLKLVLGHGLLTSEDDYHLKQRRMLQPSFKRDRIRQYGQAMIEESAAISHDWRDGDTIDIYPEMMRLALNIVARTLFNSDVAGDTARVARALDTIMDMDTRFLHPLGPLMARLPLPGNQPLWDAVADLDEILYRMIAEHRAAGDQGDMLSMLLEARDADDGSQMSDQQVRDEAITLFLAGHETTAIALTWTWYLLSQNPEVEQRFHAELDAALGDRDPQAEDFPRLPYTYRVFQESMRLYPPVYMIGREAVRPTEIGGYQIPKNGMVVVSQYATHHDPKYFPDPERFDPDRWLPEYAESRPKFSYYPFGGGQRLCIGEHFAWMEGVLALATVGRRWKMRLRPGHQVGLDPRITLRPLGGMPMVVHARSASPTQAASDATGGESPA